jgi:hypothetical protein
MAGGSTLDLRAVPRQQEPRIAHAVERDLVEGIYGALPGRAQGVLEEAVE